MGECVYVGKREASRFLFSPKAYLTSQDLRSDFVYLRPPSCGEKSLSNKECYQGKGGGGGRSGKEK